MYIKNTKTTNPTPLHTKKGGNIKKKNQTSERSQGQVRATTRTMLRDIFISLPYFFPSFHSHSTTKKEKSLKYDRKAPLRRPRSLDSTEAVLQIGGFFFNVPGGFLTFVPQNQSISLVRLSRWRYSTVSLPDLPPKTRFCELNK